MSDARYFKHYVEKDNFIITGDCGKIKIAIKPSDAVDLIGGLLKYAFSNCESVEDCD